MFFMFFEKLVTSNRESHTLVSTYTCHIPSTLDNLQFFALWDTAFYCRILYQSKI